MGCSERKNENCNTTIGIMKIQSDCVRCEKELNRCYQYDQYNKQESNYRVGVV